MNNRLLRPIRTHALMIVLLALIAPAYLWWTWDADLGQLGSDGPNYLMMAHHYAHSADADAVYKDVAAFSRFPPLYPLLLSWMGAADSLHLTHLTTTACLLFALITFYCWQILEGVPRTAAALLTLLFALLPSSWLLGLTVQSEYPYLLLSLAALSSMSAYQRTSMALALYGAATLVALAVLTRTIGIALYGPLVLICMRAPRREAALALATSVLPVALWHLLHRARLPYADALEATYRGNFLSVLHHQLATELPALRQGFASDFTLHFQLWPLTDLLGLIGLAGMLWRLRGLKPDAVYAAANLTILLLWPFPEEAGRFLWVLLPLLMAQPVLAFLIGESGRDSVTRIPFPAAVCAQSTAILVLALPSFALASDRYRNAQYTDLPAARSFIAWYGADPVHAWNAVSIQTSMINALRTVPDKVPVADCVIATRPDLINYFARRRSYFPPLNSMPDPYFGVGLRAPGCHFVYVDASIDGRYPVQMFPLKRLPPPVDVIFFSSVPEEDHGQARITSMLVKID